MFPLLSLPNELIDLIISAVTDRPTRIALAQTCQKLQPFAEAHLFKRISIHDGALISRLARDLEQPPWRVRAVEHLEVTPSMYSRRGVELMPDLVYKLSSLKTLKVEAPMINSTAKPGWWADGVVPRLMNVFVGDGALRYLTSFTMHSHGTNDRYYNIESVVPVFLSPTLKYLHLSCVDISRATETFAATNFESRRTPLETLILQRCRLPSLDLREFQAILSCPRALRSLTVLLGDGVSSFARQPDTQRMYALDFLSTIQQHSETLEYLRYTNRNIEIAPRGSPEHLNARLFSALSSIRQSTSGLSTFPRLHTLYLDYRSPLAELLLEPALTPPNLHKLGLTGLSYNYEESWHHLPAYIAAIASATPFMQLQLHSRPNGLDISDVSKHFAAGPLRDTLPTLADALNNRSSVKLVCAHQPRHIASFHPPFLHGEKMTHEAVIFDSEKVWAEDGDWDSRFEVQRYATEESEGKMAGWSGPFSGLGNLFWKE